MMSLIQNLFKFITQWWVWMPLTGVLLSLAYQNRRKAKKILSTESTLLMIEVPRNNDKKELAAEQMFASLHGILRPKSELIKEGIMQEHISFEIASIGKLIRFYIWTPKHLKNFVESQVYAQYPTAQIYEMKEDYASRQITQDVTYSAELKLIDNEVLPIKTFQNFEVDPLAAITATLAELEEDNEEMWVQILARPVDDSWHKKGEKMIEQIKSGKTVGEGIWNFFSYISQFLEALWRPPEPRESEPQRELSGRDRSRIAGIEEKTKKLGYKVKIRIVYLGNDKQTAKLRMQAMVGTFKQFNSTNLNGFTAHNYSFSDEKVAEYRARFFLNDGFILNIEELASIYHLPHTNVQTPNIVWATAKTAEPPANLPTLGTVPESEISLFGVTNFRGQNIQFGIKRADRGRHLYIIGQTSVGKSGLLELLTLSDVFYNQGFGVIDPHGDYATDILRYIPAHRVNDVIYFNPADRDFPVGFNPLEVPDPSLKNHVSSELVGVLKRMFESWGPRLEYILRYTILALLDHPNSTMLDITRMLTEKDFRDKVISTLEDPVVKNFWVKEFGSWNERFQTEAVAPVLNKVGAFTANPLIRNIIGQPKSSFNIREAMDKGQILIANLSRGLVGEDNAAILGAMLVTKIQLAAMSRADIPNINDRRPFYLYVDEFQNFATDSFAVILSEARKYGLYLTVANQYVAQMTPEVRDAVFGNVGSLISFRVGPDDAHILQRNFEPQFEASDLIQLHNRNFVAVLSIDGERSPAFSGTTLNIPPVQADNSAQIVAASRQKFGKPRTIIEEQIKLATLTPTAPKRKVAPTTRPNHSDKKSTTPAKHNNQNRKEQKTNKPRPSNKSKTTSKNTPKPKAVSKNNESGIIDEDTIINLR